MDSYKNALWETVPSSKPNKYKSFISVTEQKENKGNWGSQPREKLFDGANVQCRQTLENILFEFLAN